MNTKPILEQHFIERRKPVKIEKLEVGKEYSLSKGDIEFVKNCRFDLQLNECDYLSYDVRGKLYASKTNKEYQKRVSAIYHAYKIENGENNEAE